MLKDVIDSVLKELEAGALRFTKVGVKESDGMFEVHVKIALFKPIKLTSILELTKKLESFGVELRDILIYSPHAQAIRLSFKIPKTLPTGKA